MNTITVFSFGYWGWGNATKQLVQAIDAVEKSRGYDPPIFVDIRIRRSVRAVGFNGDNFERQMKWRHLWLNGLGNRAVIDGGNMQLKDPKEVLSLLGLVKYHANRNRRVIFFCSCERAKEKDFRCHRTMVTSHLRDRAQKNGIPIRVVEWPGYEYLPDQQIDTINPLLIDHETFKKLLHSKWLPLKYKRANPAFSALPWYSHLRVVDKTDDEERIDILTGPVHFVAGNWKLPILDVIDAKKNKTAIKKLIKSRRKSFGFFPQ